MSFLQYSILKSITSLSIYPEAVEGLRRFWMNHFSSAEQDIGVFKHAMFEDVDYYSMKYSRDRNEMDMMILAGFYNVLIETGLYNDYLIWKNRKRM